MCMTKLQTSLLLGFALIILASSTGVCEKHSFLIGTWKSNAEKSLHYLRQRKVPVSIEKLYAEIWGHQILEYEDSRYRVKNPKLDVDTGWLKYKILNENEGSLSIRDFESAAQTYDTTLFKDGNDFYIVLNSAGGLKLREYFSRYDRAD